ncbi:MAG: AAA family ATPase [Prevotella sp.]|nr:AAA family ATPase [Prevotella sp.]
MNNIKLTQYTHRPNATELGLGNTHETYMLIVSDIDLSSLFPPTVEVKVHDSKTSKEYLLKSAVNRKEFRVNQMGEIYRDYEVRPGDEILLTKIETENFSDISLTVKKYNRVVFTVSERGTEILNIDRLNMFKTNGNYNIKVYDRGNVNEIIITFKFRAKKRNDSPNETDFYDVFSNGEKVSRGTYFLTISEKPTFSTLLKSDYNVVSFDNKLIEDAKFHFRTSEISLRDSIYRPYITAIKSKPFLLLAGISGTGKSRIVRELARACWDEDSPEFTAQKPKNFEMIQVKPNWHDSSDLIGYISRVSGKAEYVIGDFLRFVTRAWVDLETPYFLCLDEMNLAPVEQYFAEFLSVIESRKSHEDGAVTTDPILAKVDEQWYFDLTAKLTENLTTNDELRAKFNSEGICIPQNLIVVGTVNMDETTFSFSRKVLDRAMTIEMNEVDLHGGLTNRYENIGKLGKEELIGTAVEGIDVYSANVEVSETVLRYLDAVNAVLEGTPFKVAYRTRNEFLLYVVNNLPYNKNQDGTEFPREYVIARALDEITNMKVLSRIEGDDTKITDDFMDRLIKVIEAELKNVSSEDNTVNSISIAKLKEMKARLATGYTSFWS